MEVILRFDKIENLDHLPAELGVLDEEVDGLLVKTILTAAAAFVPHLSASQTKTIFQQFQKFLKQNESS